MQNQGLQIPETAELFVPNQNEIKQLSFIQKAMLFLLGSAIEFRKNQVCHIFGTQPIGVKQSLMQNRNQTEQIKDVYYDRYLHKLLKMNKKNEIPEFIIDYLKSTQSQQFREFYQREFELLKEQYNIQNLIDQNLDSSFTVSFDISVFINHFLNTNHFSTQNKLFHYNFIPKLFRHQINTECLHKICLIYKQPLKSYYENHIGQLRKLFLIHYKKNDIIPVIGSFNYVVDQYLRSSQINKFKLISNPEIVNMLITYLRQHEILETAILMQDVFHIQELHFEYRLRSILTNKQWIEYEICSLIPLDKCEFYFNMHPHFFKKNLKNIKSYQDVCKFITEFRGITLLQLYNQENYEHRQNFNFNEVDTPRILLWKYLQKFKRYQSNSQNILDAPKNYEQNKFATCIICYVNCNYIFPNQSDLLKDPMIKQRQHQFKGCLNCTAVYCIGCYDRYLLSLQDVDIYGNQPPKCANCQEELSLNFSLNQLFFAGINNELKMKKRYIENKQSFYQNAALRIDTLHQAFIQEYQNETNIQIQFQRFNRHQFIDSRETEINEDKFISKQVQIKDFFRTKEIFKEDLQIPQRQTQFWIPPRQDIDQSKQQKMQNNRNILQQESQNDSSYKPNEDENLDSDSENYSFYDNRGRRFLKARKQSPYQRQNFNVVRKQRLKKIRKNICKNKSSKKVILQSRLSFLQDEQNIIVQKQNKRKQKQLKKEMEKNPLRLNQNDKRNIIQQNLFFQSQNQFNFDYKSEDDAENENDDSELNEQLNIELLNQSDHSSDMYQEIVEGKLKKVKKNNAIGANNEWSIPDNFSSKIYTEEETQTEYEEQQYYDEEEEEESEEYIPYGQDPNDQIAYNNINQLNINCHKVVNNKSLPKNDKTSKKKK